MIFFNSTLLYPTLLFFTVLCLTLLCLLYLLLLYCTLHSCTPLLDPLSTLEKTTNNEENGKTVTLKLSLPVVFLVACSTAMQYCDIWASSRGEIRSTTKSMLYQPEQKINESEPRLRGCSVRTDLECTLSNVRLHA